MSDTQAGIMPAWMKKELAYYQYNIQNYTFDCGTMPSQTGEYISKRETYYSSYNQNHSIDTIETIDYFSKPKCIRKANYVYYTHISNSTDSSVFKINPIKIEDCFDMEIFSNSLKSKMTDVGGTIDFDIIIEFFVSLYVQYGSSYSFTDYLYLDNGLTKDDLYGEASLKYRNGETEVEVTKLPKGKIFSYHGSGGPSNGNSGTMKARLSAPIKIRTY